jgi:predicted ribosome quality control (RQC) complex YloA/Tae2 family protein
MQLEIDLTKSVDENASHYFELSKKAKKKLQGAKDALEDSKKKLQKLLKEENKFLQEEQQRLEERLKTANRKKEWYEKFHWFISSNDFLCIGGKDATSNEIVIKKHMEKDDLVFHTEAPGSPFFIIKNGQNAPQITIDECAQAVAVYSKAWKMGHTIADIFHVLPNQVTKETKSGEFMGKGSFMIYGKTTHLHPKLEYAIGLLDNNIIAGPPSAIQKRTSQFFIIIPGDEKKSDLAKKLKHKFGAGNLDDIITFLPAGGAQIKKI